MNKNIAEILSPAGEMESLTAALNFGADAVYLAGKQFGMRTSSKNFSMEDLQRGVDLAHEKNSKLYITCNTLPRNNEIDKIPEYLQQLQEIGVDAFIIADLGVMELAKKYAPKVEIHVSTQAGIVNYGTANALYNMGASRVVLARELSLEDIAEIRAKTPKELEIECFVHGAMCVSFSGRCLISSYMTGRDANRGDCAQPCRWKYHLYEQNREGQYFPVEENDEGTFLYNSRDLCMIDYIPQLIKAGVYSLKIEGRAKSSYYAAVTTNAYRHALDDYIKMRDNYSLAPWIKQELNKISHREYNTGFFLGNEPGQVHSNGGYIREYDVIAICEDYKDGKAYISQRNRFFKGDIADVLPPNGVPFELPITDIIVADSQLSVDSAPHPMQKLIIPTQIKVPAGSLLRKKRS